MLVGPSLAQAQSADPQLEDNLSPELAGNLVQQAITQLEARTWISAQLVQEVHLFGQRLRGEGHYLQGPKLQSRYEVLTLLPLSRKTAVLLQVCDGRTLWQYRDIAGDRNLKIVNAERVVKAWGEAQRQGRTNDAGVRFLGVGGLPQLVRGLVDDVRFDQLATLARPDGTAGDFVLVGTWRPEAVVPLLPPGRRPTEGQRPDLSALPEHIPDRVEITLRRSDLFPRVIRWARSRKPEGDAESPPSDDPPLVETGDTLMRIEFHEIKLDEPLPAAGFQYRPNPRVPSQDITEAYLQRQGLGGLGAN
jgi:hypothetical protein